MTKAIYKVIANYDLGTIKTDEFKDLRSAKAHAKAYAKLGTQCDKWYTIKKYTKTTIFGKVVKATVEVVDEWTQW